MGEITEFIEHGAARARRAAAQAEAFVYGVVVSHNQQDDTLTVTIFRGDPGPDQTVRNVPIMRPWVGPQYGEQSQIPAGTPCLLASISNMPGVSTDNDQYACLGLYWNQRVRCLVGPDGNPIKTNERLVLDANGSYVYHSRDGATVGDKQGGLMIFGKAVAAIWGGVKTWLGVGTGGALSDTNDAVITKRYLDAALIAQTNNTNSAINANMATIQTWANANFQTGSGTAPAISPIEEVTAAQSTGSTKVKAAQ